MSWQDVLTGLKDIVLAGAAATTAWAAYRGVEKWKAELEGRANFEVAREFIRSMYRLRDEIQQCRASFVSASEFPDGYRGAIDNPSGEERGSAWAHVYRNRWSPVMDALQEFDSATLEAEALWGNEVKCAALQLRALVARLRASIDAFLRNEFSGGEDFQDRDFGLRICADINASGLETDTLSPAIQNAISDIEELVRPHLRRD